jgi:leucine dehydrogenase
MLDHEQVLVRRGARTGLPVIVAVHSTALGPALGGCRLWHYPDWRDGLADALRLSAGMTLKNATAGLAHGGGKTVIALPPGAVLDAATRRDVLLDAAELVDSLGGRYATGPDVGTTEADMAVIAEVTDSVLCVPESMGGCGDPSAHTAAGVFAAIEAVCHHLGASAASRLGAEVAGRRATVVGLGHVGGQLARQLAEAGAELTVTDIDDTCRALATELGATWCDPVEALTRPTDLLVPAALGGQLTEALVAELRCAAIVGPANNQLADDGVADLLHRRGILWLPDYLTSAGGVRFAVARELHGASYPEAVRQVRALGTLAERLLSTAARLGVSPHRAALRQLADRHGDRRADRQADSARIVPIRASSASLTKN